MLDYLRIKNLALIEDAELNFTLGINVLTGETGAGKSFILKALNFLLGDKLTVDMIRPGKEKAQVEALFLLDDKELIIRRELSATSGRSRLYLNDNLSSQDRIRELKPMLVSHTSQHAQQQLLHPSFQSNLMENLLDCPELLEEKNALLEKLGEIAKQKDEIKKKQLHLSDIREVLEMQQQEIDKVNPKPNEEKELDEMLHQAKSGYQIQKLYDDGLNILYGDNNKIGLLDQMSKFERILQAIGNEDDDFKAKIDTFSAFYQELTQIALMLRQAPPTAKNIDIDTIESRLFALSQLKRKLHRNLSEIIDLKQEIEENLSFLDECTLDLSKLDKEENELLNKLKLILEEIMPLRRNSSQKFALSLENQLKDLAFSDQVKVIPEFVKYEIWPSIEDEKVRILWKPNPGQPPQPLDKIASGGELSRFLLALTVVQKKSNDITYIFDEVDTGIGGITLNKLAEKLDNLSQDHQLILITHWPQLAAKASTHFQILKTVHDGETFTSCISLDSPKRHAELARMAGGGEQGELLASSLEKSDSQ